MAVQAKYLSRDGGHTGWGGQRRQVLPRRIRLAGAPGALPLEIVRLRPRARRRGTSGMMSVACGIVGPRAGLRPGARSGRPRGTEFNASEREQISVEILWAVEHQTVAGA